MELSRYVHVGPRGNVPTWAWQWYTSHLAVLVLPDRFGSLLKDVTRSGSCVVQDPDLVVALLCCELLERFVDLVHVHSFNSARSFRDSETLRQVLHGPLDSVFASDDLVL